MAPTRMVSPDIATLQPKPASGVASPAVSFCDCVQVAPERVNTYAAPGVPVASTEVLPGAPTTAVSPDTAAAYPRLPIVSPAATASRC